MKEIKISTMNQSDKESALNEIRLLASINSNYVEKYYEAFYDDKSKTLCIIMDIAEKGDIQQLIKEYKQKRGIIPEQDIWDIFINVTKGLRDLHKMKILHRDIKSANIFLHDKNQAKIGDLNVSKIQREGFAKTQTGTPY